MALTRKTKDSMWETEVYVVSQLSFDKGPFLFDGPLKDVLASIKQIEELVPKEHRETIRFHLDEDHSGYECTYTKLQVSYIRPATESEIKTANYDELTRRKQNEARERQQLEMLKKKYEG